MITKDDCMTILVKLGDEGISVNSVIRKLLIAKEVPLDVLKFIAENRGMEVINFYEMLRKRYNQKKSPIYKNILDDLNNDKEIITTLSCLLTQVLLYGEKLSNPSLFYKEVRAEEITKVLNNYFKDENTEICKALLRLIKTDLLVLEYINGRRTLTA